MNIYEIFACKYNKDLYNSVIFIEKIIKTLS